MRNAAGRNSWARDKQLALKREHMHAAMRRADGNERGPCRHGRVVLVIAKCLVNLRHHKMAITWELGSGIIIINQHA